MPSPVATFWQRFYQQAEKAMKDSAFVFQPRVYVCFANFTLIQNEYTKC